MPNSTYIHPKINLKKKLNQNHGVILQGVITLAYEGKIPINETKSIDKVTACWRYLLIRWGINSNVVNNPIFHVTSNHNLHPFENSTVPFMLPFCDPPLLSVEKGDPMLYLFICSLKRR